MPRFVRTGRSLRRPSKLSGRLPDNALPIPVTNQMSSYSCGAACAAAVMRYFGKHDGAEREVRSSIKTNHEGTYMRNVSRFLREHGLGARVIVNESVKNLLAKFSAGNVPILAIQAWPFPINGKTGSVFRGCKYGHYVVMVGFDKNNIYFMDPNIKTGNYGYMPLFELVRRWRDVGDRGQCVDRQVIWVSGKPVRRQRIVRGVTKIN